MAEWKEISKGSTALLVEGARRIGKSTIVEEFAKNEYESYILIDFNEASKEVKALFDDLMNMDFIFLFLQNTYNASMPRLMLTIKHCMSESRLSSSMRYNNVRKPDKPSSIW